MGDFSCAGHQASSCKWKGEALPCDGVAEVTAVKLPPSHGCSGNQVPGLLSSYPFLGPLTQEALYIGGMEDQWDDQGVEPSGI